MKKVTLQRVQVACLMNIQSAARCNPEEWSSGLNMLHIVIDRETWKKTCLTLYRKTSNISRTLLGNHSDVVGALPVGAAPTTFSFST